jgi:L-ascorbate metabolism protein UlaG (beta-lactamase superfamily)
MELTWYGHACFRITDRKLLTVVTDPYDTQAVGYGALELTADIVTSSVDLPGHNHLTSIKGDPYAISGPGEYEIGGVFITGVQTNGRISEQEPRNTLYVFDYNGINVAHLGMLNRVPSQAEVEALGPVNVALVPVGGAGGLNAAKAAEVISLLEPNIVIPMLYATPASAVPLDALGKFLKEMGLAEVETLPALQLNGTANLPDETRVVVLDYKRA